MSEQEIPTRSDMEDRRLMRDFDSMKITKEGFGLCPKETHVYSIVNFQHSDDSSTPVSDANRSLTPLQTPPSRREHLRAMEYALKASDDELESLGIEVLGVAKKGTRSDDQFVTIDKKKTVAKCTVCGRRIARKTKWHTRWNIYWCETCRFHS